MRYLQTQYLNLEIPGTVPWQGIDGWWPMYAFPGDIFSVRSKGANLKKKLLGLAGVLEPPLRRQWVEGQAGDLRATMKK